MCVYGGVIYINGPRPYAILPCTVELMHRIYHRDDIIDRCVWHHVVDRVEDVAAISREDLTAGQYFPSNLLRRSKWESPLGIHAAPPENYVFAELLLQEGRIHAFGGALHGIEDVKAGFDEVRNEGSHRTA